MTETEASGTTEAKTPVVADPAPKPFTGVWDDMTHGNYKAMLEDIKTEAEAAIASGDMTLQKWARSTGTFAGLLLTFLAHTDPAEFDKFSGAVKEAGEIGEEAVNLATKTTP